VPSRSARRMFCIFMASMTTNRSPVFTSWPGITATAASKPGMGESTKFDRSGGSLRGIRRRSSAARRGSTEYSNCTPMQERR